MGPIALVISCILYLIASYDFYKKRNYPMSWVFLCYALSNIGFFYASLASGDPRGDGVG